jgi:hypothetical protein
MFHFFGCIITNYFAFQQFINYPLSYEQVANTYHEALIKDMELWKHNEEQGLDPPYHSEAIDLSYHPFPEILWVKRDDFPKEMCYKLEYLETKTATGSTKNRYHETHLFRGCMFTMLPLHEETCRFINYFNPEELKLTAKVIRFKEDWHLTEEAPQPFEPGCTRIWLGEEEEDPCVKEKKEEENMAKLVQEAMDNIDDPGRKTTFEYYPRCDCAKWDCEKKEEKKEEETPKLACMAIGCPGSEPK